MEFMNYKLLLLDVDGTLLNARNVVSDEDKKAIEAARERGVRIALCTGRVNQATQVVLSDLNLDGYHIFSDGAVVASADNREIIYAKTIEKTLAKQLAEYVHEKRITTIDFFTPTDEYIEAKTQPWVTDIRRNFFGLDPQVIDFSRLCDTDRIIKATHAVASVQDRGLAKDFQTCFGNKLRFSVSNNVTYPEIDFFNIIDPGVSKGEAVNYLIDYLGLKAEECIGIGDGKNDVPLLTRVGLGIAMGHAPEELKRVAGYVTCDIDNCGVAAAIDRFILNGN